ncbi:hypothetical protein IV102_13860 [bacterium]|nr:hypothetical protein [bacterium]
MIGHALPDTVAESLAELLLVIGCGEESAVFAFQRLAGRGELQHHAQGQLLRIAREEEHHEQLLRGLRASLPTPRPDPLLKGRLRRFFLTLESREIGVHFARLAALDSAVCSILGELRSPKGKIHLESGIARIFQNIHEDEANHVRTALSLGHELAGRQRFLEEWVWTRQRLGALLDMKAEAFEGVGIDPRRLHQRLRKVPRLA